MSAELAPDLQDKLEELERELEVRQCSSLLGRRCAFTQAIGHASLGTHWPYVCSWPPNSSSYDTSPTANHLILPYRKAISQKKGMSLCLPTRTSLFVHELVNKSRSHKPTAPTTCPYLALTYLRLHQPQIPETKDTAAVALRSHPAHSPEWPAHTLAR